ncbi:MAG: DNA replication/repair protein RecF [Alphaproteobacteria bacterium]
MAYVSSLKLHNFRCYTDARLDSLAPGFVVLAGPNGAGKTNVLEAVSLLSPGRGLRGAKILEIQCREAGAPWAVSSTVTDKNGSVQIGTGLDAQSEKRVVRINSETVKAQATLADYLSCVWLTPQMDRLFIDSAGHRRKFLDRLIFAFDPGHAGRVNRYENAMAQRSRLLRDGHGDITWLEALEAQMAETGIAIAAARLEFVSRLQSASDRKRDEAFPAARLHAAGTLEVLLGQSPALEVEDMFKYQLTESRNRDAVTGGAASGPHKSDLRVIYASKDMEADQCSTGEQKALLIGIILAHARLIAAERGAPPILLLDEVAAHLDPERRAALYDVLGSLGGQVWLTGTEEKLFESIQDSGQFFHVENATITSAVIASAAKQSRSNG